MCQQSIVDDLFSRAQLRAEEEHQRRVSNARKAASGLPMSVVYLAQLRGQSHNMAPAISKWCEVSALETSKTRRYGAVDWLAYSCAVSHWEWDALREELEAGRELAKENGEAVQTVVRGREVLIYPYGEGKGRASCRYVMRVDGVRVRIADRPESDGFPNVFVEYRGHALLLFGLRELLGRTDSLFADWRMSCGQTWVGRADFASDIVGLDMSTVYASLHGKQFITPARKYQIHGDLHEATTETVSVGARGASCQLRMYNKVLEVAQQPQKLEAMRTIAWGGEVPEVCTRVEFQLKREKLIELGVSSLEQFLSSIPRLCNYLTAVWFRVGSGEVDRDNTARAALADWWLSVRAHFERWSSEWIDQAIVAVKKSGTTAKAMVKQAMGCIQRCWAELGVVPESASQAMALVDSIVGLSFAEFQQGVRDKHRRCEALALTHLDESPGSSLSQVQKAQAWKAAHSVYNYEGAICPTS